jgi:hypothetical protein
VLTRSLRSEIVRLIVMGEEIRWKVLCCEMRKTNPRRPENWQEIPHWRDDGIEQLGTNASRESQSSVIPFALGLTNRRTPAAASQILPFILIWPHVLCTPRIKSLKSPGQADACIRYRATEWVQHFVSVRFVDFATPWTSDFELCSAICFMKAEKVSPQSDTAH